MFKSNFQGGPCAISLAIRHCSRCQKDSGPTRMLHRDQRPAGRSRSCLNVCRVPPDQRALAWPGAAAFRHRRFSWKRQDRLQARRRRGVQAPECGIGRCCRKAPRQFPSRSVAVMMRARRQSEPRVRAPAGTLALAPSHCPLRHCRRHMQRQRRRRLSAQETGWSKCSFLLDP